SGSVWVVDARKHKVIREIRIEIEGAKPMGITMSKDGRTAYVGCGRSTAIAMIDTAANQVTKIIRGVGTRVWGVGLTPDGRKLYTANGPSNDVSAIELSSGTVVKRIAAGKAPWGIAISP